MNNYIWESEHDIQDVLNELIALTDKPNVIDRNLFDYKSFNYKYLETEKCRFNLWFHYACSRASYQPAPIKGNITKATKGCKIEAHIQSWFTVVDSLFLFSLLAVLYIAAIAAFIARFTGWIAISIMFCLIATGILIRFLYTRKKWTSENTLLDLIDHAASAERQKGIRKGL